MRQRGGFTLIEIVLAMAIVVVILMMAVPSMNGLMADRGLRRSLDEMNRLVVQAQERSISEGRSYLIVWKNKKFELRPELFLKGETRGPIATLRWQKGDAYTLSFPASIEEEPPSEWIFWPSGNCEPAVVTFKGNYGSWKANYSALTGRAELVSYATR